ncbi:MAG: TIGR03790 family protein [Vicinamibacterales bacterium]
MAALALGLALAWAAPAGAQSGANVLVVVNAASQASVEIGVYYARVRQVPDVNFVRISAPVTDQISRADFERTIQAPIARHLWTQRLQDQVLYIVLTKDVPLRIEGSAGLDGTMASVDSELTLLYRRMLGRDDPILGRVDNPLFLGDRPVDEARPVARTTSDLYLVTRLDGYSVADVRGLIDRGLSPTTAGRIVLDQRGIPGDRGGDLWLETTSDRLEAEGARDRITLDQTPARAAVTDPVLGYYSWGSNDPANQLRHLGLTFAPGAIGGLFVSTDGRTFTAPPDDWTLAPTLTVPTGGQSLAGDLIHDGITGLSAHVAEPFLDAIIRPQILFPAYLRGLNLAEAYYTAMPFLSWQTIVLGDPLCAPFRDRIVPPSELYEAGLDPDSAAPPIFTRRWLDLQAGTRFNTEALRLELRARGMRATGQTDDMAAVLERLVSLEPRLTSEALLLATLREQEGEYDRAITLYRQVVGLEPSNVVALNNLAFALAEHGGDVSEALGFAQRAVAAAPTPDTLDTLGWVEHLAGRNDEAAAHLDRALRLAPTHVEALVHSAVVSAALGDLVKARRALDTAEARDPTVKSREIVIRLRREIGGGRTPADRLT